MPFGRDRVLQAGVELADEVGIAGVSMRRLAQGLGVVPMALYRHVADKEELLDGMVDVVIEEFTPPDPELGWKDCVRQQLLSARRAVLRHPWARRAIESRTRRTPAVLAYMDAVARAFIAGGFLRGPDSPRHACPGQPHLRGSAQMLDESQSEPESSAKGQPDPVLAAEFAQRYPHIVQIAVAATSRERADGGQGCDEQFEFEFALDVLLDGADRLRRSRLDLR